MTTDTPVHVTLLEGFANTVDVEDGVDLIADARGLTGWLVGQGLLRRRTATSDADLALAHRLRDGLRAALASHHTDEPASSSLDEVADLLPLRLSCRTDPPQLVPCDDGVRGALAQILVAVNDAVADDTWRRLKICPADDCAVAFYDTSKNRSRTWCSMEVCGNRAKTRKYRARQRAAS